MPLPKGIRRLPSNRSNPAPLQPQSSLAEASPVSPAEKAPDWWQEVQYQRRTLASERKTHGVIYSLLTKQITLLEQQVSDLRTAAISNLAAGMRQQ